MDSSAKAGKRTFEMPDADKRLKAICQKGLKGRFGDNPPDAVKERLAHELKVVARNKHSKYYLLAEMLAEEAERLHHAVFFRGTITSSLIAYTSGISHVNPMEPEYGGVNLPFEMTGEEYEGIAPAVDIQCSTAFILFAQIYLARILPEYRCVSYPLAGDAGVRSVRIYLVKEDEMPERDPLDIEGTNKDEYPDFMFFDDYFRITLVGDSKMERVRYYTFYNEKAVDFRETDLDKVIPQIWELEKREGTLLTAFKGLKVRTYEELITVLGMSFAAGAWEGVPQKMVLEGRLPLADMIGSRDDLFTYLVNIGFDREEAFEISNRVRKGKRLTGEQAVQMKKQGAADWVLEFCGQVRYLFPRAHLAQIIRRDAFLTCG